jgi:DNA-binding NarL/FixJ family response regulator
LRRIVILAALAFGLLTAINFLEMARGGEPFDAIAVLLDFVDTALLIGGIVAVALIAIEGRDLARQRVGLADKLERARAEGDRWRQTAQTYLRGLGEAINEQFKVWKLTASESEIAMGLLKGLTHKEIARLRDTSEATVRQQARSIYSKSGLGSRAELAAYFLEDLTAPNANDESRVITPISFVDRG